MCPPLSRTDNQRILFLNASDYMGNLHESIEIKATYFNLT
jgi:hypothetical protein